MVTARSDYEYVTIDDGIMVNGDIMPQRDANGDGSWKVLRGEDVAFCLEAACERALVAGTNGPDTVWSSVSRAIFGGRWQAAIGALKACAVQACTAGTNAPYMRELPAAVPDFATVPHLYSQLYFDPDSLLGDASKFETWQPLVANYVRDVFRDIKRLTMFHHNGSFSRSTEEFTRTQGGGDNRPDSTAYGNQVFDYNAVRWPSESFLANKGGWSRAIADIGEHSFVPTATVDTSHCASSKLVVEYQFDIVRGNCDGAAKGGETSRTTKHYIWVQEVQGGEFSLQARSLSSIGEIMLKSYNGGNFPSHETLDDGTWFMATAVIKSIRAVVYLDDHTDFSHIAWD